MVDPIHIITNSMEIVDSVELAQAYKVSKEGVKSVARSRVILYEGAQWSAADRGLNMLLAACSGEVARGSKEEKPELHAIAASAMKSTDEGSEPAEERERAMDAVIEATISFNWQCEERNGMRIAKDKEWLILATSIPFRAPREEDFRSSQRQEGMGGGPSILSGVEDSQRVAKRARELEKDSATSGRGTESMTAPSTAGERESAADSGNLTKTNNRLKVSDVSYHRSSHNHKPSSLPSLSISNMYRIYRVQRGEVSYEYVDQCIPRIRAGRNKRTKLKGSHIAGLVKIACYAQNSRTGFVRPDGRLAAVEFTG